MTYEPETLYCANHPQTPTMLRCNRCEKPICIQCAVRTPTGYRCKECVRGHQKVFETALWQDYLLGGGVAFVLSLIGSFLVPALGWFSIFVVPIVGVIVGEAARFATRRRRARSLFLTVTVMTALGCLPVLLLSLGSLLGIGTMPGAVSFSSPLFLLIWRGLYAVIVTSTVYYRLAGINIR